MTRQSHIYEPWVIMDLHNLSLVALINICPFTKPLRPAVFNCLLTWICNASVTYFLMSPRTFSGLFWMKVGFLLLFSLILLRTTFVAFTFLFIYDEIFQHTLPYIGGFIFHNRNKQNSAELTQNCPPILATSHGEKAYSNPLLSP